MSSLTHGDNISEVEIANISPYGVWLLAHGKELFMSYKHFPWFKDQTLKTIINVEEPSPEHCYWPDLDIDVTEEIIEHPERSHLHQKSHNKTIHSHAKQHAGGC